MVYHFVVLCEDDAGEEAALFHWLTESLPEFTELVATAETAAHRYDERCFARYVGWEELPLSGAGEGWVLFDYANHEPRTLLEARDNIDRESLIRYKNMRLTAYIRGGEFAAAKALEELKSLPVKRFSLFKAKDVHLRATLEWPMDFQKKIDVRARLGDDEARMDLDAFAVKFNCEFITDFLPTTEYFRRRDGKWEHYPEQPYTVNVNDVRDLEELNKRLSDLAQRLTRL